MERFRLIQGNNCKFISRGTLPEGNNPEENYTVKKDKVNIFQNNVKKKSGSAWTLQACHKNEKLVEENNDDHVQRSTEQFNLREGWVSLPSEEVTVALGRLLDSQF